MLGVDERGLPVSWGQIATPNAVPPLLARALANEIAKALRQVQRREGLGVRTAA